MQATSRALRRAVAMTAAARRTALSTAMFSTRVSAPKAAMSSATPARMTAAAFTIARSHLMQQRTLSSASSASSAPVLTFEVPDKKAYPREFRVTGANGFLPLSDPLEALPPRFAELDTLLREMPVVRPDGEPGLLAKGQLGHRVLATLPEYDLAKDPLLSSTRPEDQDERGRLLVALFRDYTFLCSAYLLEPCDINHRQFGKYGQGRDVLPRQIARPMAWVARQIGARPFMDYAMSYALYNWRRVDKAGGLEFENLRLVRTLHGGADEAGFILVHVALVAHTARQAQHSLEMLNALEKKDRAAFDRALAAHRDNFATINRVMNTMWGRSRPEGYMDLRTWIYGIRNQPMFPNGILYEGCTEADVGGTSAPAGTAGRIVSDIRGESGAMDSTIPMADMLLEVTYPDNPLTDILMEFREYRPTTHHAALQQVAARAKALKLRAFAHADPHSAVLYLANLDQVREFRQTHWTYTKQYIIQHTSHPVATGGSPITTWLPNQLHAVTNCMRDTAAVIEQSRASLSEDDRSLFDSTMRRTDAQDRVLMREVEKLRKQFNQ